MDSNQFTQQLVEFSQVEQQINTNSNLQTLITQGQSAAGANAVGYLGKDVTITNGQGGLSNGSADWTYSLQAPSAATTLSVTNAAGTVVYSTAGATGAGSHDFKWDGTDNNGNKLPDGTYTLTATAQDAAANTIATTVSSTGVVNEVNMTGSAPSLVIGPMSVPLSSVSLVGSAVN
jgi:flagellar basal-body rod modification protein FlgD